MSRYERVVVPCDGQPQPATVAVARGVAAHLGIPVTLFSIVSAGLEADDAAELDRIAAALGPDVTAAVQLDDGRPIAEQLAEVAGRADTLMCLPTRAKSALIDAAFGSIGDDVVRLSEADLLVIGPNCAPSFDGTRLLLAVDGLSISEEDRHAAMDLSATFGLSPEFVTVAEAADAVVGDGGAALPHRTLTGPPAEALATVSALPGTAMIAMSPRHRRSLERLLVGSTTRKVLRQAECPVLIRRRVPAGVGGSARAS